MLSNYFYNIFLLYFSTSFLEQRENIPWSKGKTINIPTLIKVVPHQINLLNLKKVSVSFVVDNNVILK
jgi:hypothetical protein